MEWGEVYDEEKSSRNIFCQVACASFESFMENQCCSAADCVESNWWLEAVKLSRYYTFHKHIN